MQMPSDLPGGLQRYWTPLQRLLTETRAALPAAERTALDAFQAGGGKLLLTSDGDVITVYLANEQTRRVIQWGQVPTLALEDCGAAN